MNIKTILLGAALFSTLGGAAFAGHPWNLQRVSAERDYFMYMVENVSWKFFTEFM